MAQTGWFNRNKTGYSIKHESRRHSLAAKGIKTARPKGVKNVSFSGSPTPNFDMVKKDRDMCISDYHTILSRLGFRGKDRRVHDDHVHINLYGVWYKVGKETIRELGRLHNAINDIEDKLGLTAPMGKETVISFGKAKVTEKGLKEVAKLPFISKDFAKKHKGKPVNIVFRDILDKIPYGKNLTRENAVMYADMVIAKDALRKLKAWEVKKLMQFSMLSVKATQVKTKEAKEAMKNIIDPKKLKELQDFAGRPIYLSGKYKNVGNRLSSKTIKKYTYDARSLRNQLNKRIYVTKDECKKKGWNKLKLLSVVLLASKMKHFDFLKGKTRWSAIRDWKNYPHEKNIMFDVQYYDDEKNNNSKKIMSLLKEYNKKIIGEEKLYARIEPVESSTL